MLKYIQEKSSSRLILIQDNEATAGAPLLLSLIKQLSASNVTINVFLYEHHSVEFESLPFFNKEKFVLYDYFSNFFEWSKHQNDFQSYSHCLMEQINASSFGNESIIVIDSLNPLLRNSSSRKCLWMLHQFLSNKKVKHVVSLFHSQLLDLSTCLQLKHSASTFLAVTNELNKQSSFPILSNFGKKDKNICSVVHKKQNGKVVVSDEEYYISTDTYDIALKTWTPLTKNVSHHQTFSSTSLFNDSNVTFNLSLSKAENDQRKNLVMPYAKIQVNNSEESEKTGGKIFYEADEADLYEDDPDDDLDI